MTTSLPRALRPDEYDDVDLDDDGSSRSQIPHRKLILVTIAVVLLGAVASWVVAFSPVFGVRTVDVRGEHVLSGDAIRSAAAIAGGTPLVRLDTDAIRNRIEKLPDVAAATVTTSFPSTVHITVTERTPIGVVHTGDDYRLVDRSGAQYRDVHKRPNRLPLFAVPKGSTAQPTGRSVATVAAALTGKLRAKINSIQALDPTAITLVLNDGRLVHWGSSTDSVEKARVLPVLLRRTAGDDTAQIDVTNPGQPFTR